MRKYLNLSWNLRTSREMDSRGKKSVNKSINNKILRPKRDDFTSIFNSDQLCNLSNFITLSQAFSILYIKLGQESWLHICVNLIK
jgi:hypothetical protein